MSNVTINSLPTYPGTVDGSADLIPIYDNSGTSTNSVSRNTFLNIASQPLGLTDAQSPTNKTFNNTNSFTIKDGSLTLQNTSSTTKQATFSLSGITAGQTRIMTLPDYNATLASLAGTETLTNKTLTSPAITSPTITNATLSADAITGFSSSSTGTIYGISVTSGTIGSAALATNSVTTTKITNASVTADKLSTGATASTVITASETTTSTSYADMTTTTDSVTVTIGANGLALVILSCTKLYNNTGTSETYVSFAVSGASTVAASDNSSISVVASAANLPQIGGGAAFLVTGLTPGSNTFTAKYRVSANTGGFSNRSISVVPL